MGGSEKSSSIVNTFSTLLLKAWEKWDVRGMVLFSLTLQIVLSILGGRRKYKINAFLKIILWFAYLGADWIAIATLGKLSSSNIESPTNVLRAYWAPLLLLHLGGPDTITAYSFEDNRLWIRHLLILVVKAILVIYLVCMSWTFSWVSFLSLPLILAGIIKYVEKILCLKLNNSQKTEAVISNLFNPQGPQPTENQALDLLLKENPIVLRGYLFFTVMRPDVNDYLSSHNSSDLGVKIRTYLKETTGIDGSSAINSMDKFFFSAIREIFKVHAVQLGFMFDVVYTKVALIYTKRGCSLRLTSFISSFLVLLLFFVSIINEPKFHFSRVDIAITGILLSGAIVLEFYAAWVMLSSDWAILVAVFHHNVMVRKMFKAALKYFPRSLHQSKKWLEHMGQFDLLEYCLRYKKKKANESCGILRKITNWSEITEMWHKYKFTKSVEVPPFLKRVASYVNLIEAITFEESFKTPRGEKALQKRQQFAQLKWSIELDFDHSIIVWHLATSVCYLQEDPRDDNVEISKHVSNYMMYLLAMCPALILPEHDKSFWLDHTYDKLKELLSHASDIKEAASTLVPNVHEDDPESSEPISVEYLQVDVSPTSHIRNGASTLHSNPDNVHEGELESSTQKELEEILKEDVISLVTLLKRSANKWELIRDVWIEMFFCAAVSSQHINHVKQLGEGIEFLSLIRLFVGPDVVRNSLKSK